MPDLDDGLAALARHAERTARLEPAAAIRFRADRRRRRRYTAATALGLVAAVALGTGIALAQPGRRSPLPPNGSPSPAPSTAPDSPRPVPSFASRGSDEKQTGLKFQRSYGVVPANGSNGTGLVVGPDGRIGVASTATTRSFTVAVMTEENPEWIIRLDEKGGSRCMSVRPDGTLGLARCTPSDLHQRFELRRGADDAAWGLPAYRIVAVDPGATRWLTWDPAAGRLTMTAKASGQLITGWVFVDQGPSTLGR